ncbi:FHA domain-containing protein [[Phormidium] sp. ETS-05]|uniref:FHA domain-containing protein n=1 Tax=[Phormidium] sp. ETS-05 TaxID=222819 RepID=UPI0018EF1C28|nr:FHA domain-containing protein [[Phormidium] sp. ETS-05]
MITLTLLHPLQSTPIKSWSFENESVIRVGRATDNNVVLYSAVVSRHHLELRHQGRKWDLISLGTNGTYVEGKFIEKMTVTDGLIVRLAQSGPKIQINIGAIPPRTRFDEEILGEWMRKDGTLGETTSEEDTAASTRPIPPPVRVVSSPDVPE